MVRTVGGGGGVPWAEEAAGGRTGASTCAACDSGRALAPPERGRPGAHVGDQWRARDRGGRRRRVVGPSRGVWRATRGDARPGLSEARPWPARARPRRPPPPRGPRHPPHLAQTRPSIEQRGLEPRCPPRARAAARAGRHPRRHRPSHPTPPPSHRHGRALHRGGGTAPSPLTQTPRPARPPQTRAPPRPPPPWAPAR